MAIAEVLLPYNNLSPHKSEVSQALLDQPRAASYAGRVTPQFLSALRSNARQLHTYLVTYTQYANDFKGGDLAALTDQLTAAEKLHSLATHEGGQEESLQHRLTMAAGAYYQFMAATKSMCQAVWAQFDDLYIYLGLTVVAAVTIGLALLLLTTGLLQNYGASGSLLKVVLRCLGGWDGGGVVACVVVLFHCVSLVSNSFVVYEQDLVVYLVQTLLIFLLVTRVRLALSSGHHWASQYGWASLLSLLFKASWQAFGVMLCVRMTKLFVFCRDQQLDCEQSSFTLPLSTALDAVGWLALVRYIVSCSALLTIAPLSAGYFVSYLGKEASPSLRRAVKFGTPFAAVCVCLFWGFQALPPSITANLPSWMHVLLPRLVYGASLWVIVVAIGCPIQTRTDGSPAGIKARVKKPQCEANSSPSTILLAPLGVVLVSVWVPLCMLLNDAVSLSACLFVVQLVLTLQLLSELPQGQYNI